MTSAPTQAGSTAPVSASTPGRQVDGEQTQGWPLRPLRHDIAEQGFEDAFNGARAARPEHRVDDDVRRSQCRAKLRCPGRDDERALRQDGRELRFAVWAVPGQANGDVSAPTSAACAPRPDRRAPLLPLPTSTRVCVPTTRPRIRLTLRATSRPAFSIRASVLVPARSALCSRTRIWSDVTIFIGWGPLLSCSESYPRASLRRNGGWNSSTGRGHSAWLFSFAPMSLEPPWGRAVPRLSAPGAIPSSAASIAGLPSSRTY